MALGLRMKPTTQARGRLSGVNAAPLPRVETGVMPVLFPTPAADFDHPLDILDGCHERIRRQCATLGKISEHLMAGRDAAPAQESARAIIRYFDTAGMHHHHDEEEDLFPALEAAAPEAERAAVRELTGRLRQDHVRLDAQWSEMRANLCAIAEGRQWHLDARMAQAFAAAYDRHIATEEAELLPLARRLLDEEATRRMGAHMAERRGVVRRTL